MTATASPVDAPSAKPPTLESLQTELETVLRAGLPITPRSVGPAMLALRGVWARAVDPTDPLARVDAADKLVRQQIRKVRRLGHRDLRDSPRILFGLGDGAGRNLTARRRTAASNSGYGYHHFRKHIEPRIVEHLAWLLHQDSLQYVPRARQAPSPTASGDTPTISDEDVGDPDRAAHEILVSRIWSAVYELRADLLTREQVRGIAAEEPRFSDSDSAARDTLGRLLLLIDEYLERWGKSIFHGEAEYNAEALIRLAGWSGELTREEALELRWAAARAR